MNVGERIKLRRKQLGMSAETLAAMLAISPATMYRYENGDIDKLPSTFLEPLAAALTTTPDWLMGWDSTPPQPALRDDEESLVGLYRQLNRQGQELVMQTAVTAVRSELYLPGDGAADPLTADIG